MRSHILLVSIFALAACGGDDGNGTPIDAAQSDAPATAVRAVTCPTTPDATVTTTGFAFSPTASTIPVNGIVRFMPAAAHDVKPHPSQATDAGLVVGFGDDKCLQFTTAGTFNFICSAHPSMMGAITVQ